MELIELFVKLLLHICLNRIIRNYKFYFCICLNSFLLCLLFQNLKASNQTCILAMPSKNKTRKIVKLIKSVNPSKDQLTLPCEWRGCNFVTDKMADFLDHVSNHLELEDRDCMDTNSLISSRKIFSRLRFCLCYEYHPSFLDNCVCRAV